MGPAPFQSEKVTVADARRLIAQAKLAAYGGKADQLGSNEVTVNRDLIFNDPLIQRLRQFAAKEVAKGDATSYMTAGAS